MALAAENRVSIVLDFADGRYLFHLKMPQLVELQTKCGAGIGAIYARMLKGRYVTAQGQIGVSEEAEWHVVDILETIRLGLIGGGKGEVNDQPVQMSTIRANELVERYVIGQPWHDAWALATAVLGAAVEGVPEVPAGVGAAPAEGA